MKEITSLRREQNRATFLGFIDVARAYDTVHRPSLWLKLSEAGLGGRFLDLIATMYAKINRSIMVNGTLSAEFPVEAGVPQGAVLSPFLYASYIDGLHAALGQAGLGVFIYGRRVPALLYADDIVLLARTAEELQKMLDDVSQLFASAFASVNHFVQHSTNDF